MLGAMCIRSYHHCVRDPQSANKHNMTEEIPVEQDTESNLVLSDIAIKHLGIVTLETSNSDRQDFHDLAVWSIKAALAAAYEAGLKAQKA